MCMLGLTYLEMSIWRCMGPSGDKKLQFRREVQDEDVNKELDKIIQESWHLEK